MYPVKLNIHQRGYLCQFTNINVRIVNFDLNKFAASKMPMLTLDVCAVKVTMSIVLSHFSTHPAVDGHCRVPVDVATVPAMLAAHVGQDK